MKRMIFLMIVVVLFGGIPSQSHALPTITISSGSLQTEIVDYTGTGFPTGDNDPAAGVINTTVGIDGWIVNLIGKVTNQSLELSVYEIAQSSVNNLYFSFSQSGFTVTGSGDFILDGSAGGAVGTVNATAFYDKSNALFGTDTMIGTLEITGTGKSETSKAITISNYSMTINTVIFSVPSTESNNTGEAIIYPGSIVEAGTPNFVERLTVPEPGTILLLGLGLLGVGIAMRRKL
jgi:hypothetical protein